MKNSNVINMMAAQKGERTTARMKLATKTDLKGILLSISGKEADLMVKAISDQNWDLCKNVFNFASHRYFQE